MNAYDFVHLALYALGDEVRGKTKLQKTIYFLGILSGSKDDLGFRPHFYGPYSAEVSDAVAHLRSLGFVDQNVSSWGSKDEAGFEVARYDFRLNDEGRSAADTKARKYPDELRRLRDAVEKFERMKDQDYEKLSIAAKTYFMLGEKRGKAGKEELARLAQKFGWSVNPDQVSEAARFLESLGLVRLEP
jgi:uncharacterized protein YwgA